MHQRQISLRSLMLLTAIAPPLVALAVGAFGKTLALMFWGYVLVIGWSIICFLLFAAVVFLPTMALVALVEWVMGLYGKRDRRQDRT